MNKRYKVKLDERTSVNITEKKDLKKWQRKYPDAKIVGTIYLENCN